MIKVLMAALAALFLSATSFAGGATVAATTDACVTEAKVVADVMSANPGATMHRLTGVQAVGFIDFEGAQTETKLDGDTVLIFRHPAAPQIAYVVIIKNGCFTAAGRRPNDEITHAEGQGA